MDEKIMKVITPESEVFWMGGHDAQEAFSSFGDDVTVELLVAVPVLLMQEVRDLVSMDLGDLDHALMDLRQMVQELDEGMEHDRSDQTRP